MDAHDRYWRDFYTRWAPRYDLTVRLWSLFWGFSDERERRLMVSRLELQPGDRVLEVSVGTGRNVPFLAEGVGPAGKIVGLDLSRGMLRQCERKLQRLGVAVDLVEGEAGRLPFVAGSFDAVLCCCGINEFGDKRAAIEEMRRVARSGAKIVIADEGVRPNAPKTLRRRVVARFYPLYRHQPPVELIPADHRLDWFRAENCYLVDFVNS